MDIRRNDKKNKEKKIEDGQIPLLVSKSQIYFGREKKKRNDE